MGGLIVLIVIATSIGVAIDAGQRDWSHSRLAKSPLGWLVGCLLLWFVFFPAYLLVRNRAPQKVAVTAGVPTCPQCHRAVQVGGRFCPFCGSSYHA